MGVDIGVIAVQGDVSEHIASFRRAMLTSELKGSVREVRSAGEIAMYDALALPGGESTTITRMIDRFGMRQPLENFDGGIFATCAGLVLMARDIEDDQGIAPLGLMDIVVKRNAFGRQRESFEADITIQGFESPYHAVFIRAPVVTAVGTHAESLASLDQGTVAVRQGKHMATSFHPELTSDPRLHHLFLNGLR